MNKAKIDLYPHNLETYNNICELWKTSNKAAAVQATGTGKTMLILKCTYDFNESGNVLIFAPSNYILEQINKKADYDLKNVTMMTYSKLTFMINDEIEKLNPSLIIFDEFHRCGAEHWGIGIQSLLTTFPNAKLLGVSATPIRYLDNERDMTDELFDGNLAVNLSLAEAIVKGILPMPKYISALYTFEEEIVNLQHKIDSSRNNDEEKLELFKEVKKLKKMLEKSKGVPAILEKYLEKKGGKFIIFCKDRNHLNEMKAVVLSWFKKARIGEKIESYIVLSGDLEKSKQLKSFIDNKNNDNIRLLFSVDMLNEGLHIEGVNGVVLLRPTTSPIIYYQQIGRAIDAGSKIKPVIFDLVNNFNSMESKTLKEDLQQRLNEENEKLRSINEEELKISDFMIYDELNNIVDVFNSIEERLLDNWDTMFEQYKNEKDNRIQQKTLWWLSKQRLLYKQNKINSKKVQLLNEVGFVWDVSDESWENQIDALKHYKKEFGDCNVNSKYKIKGINLGSWVSNVRYDFKNNKLSKEKITQLNEISFIWDVLNYTWNLKYEEYKIEIENGNIGYSSELGKWAYEQRRIYNKGGLTQKQINLLNEIDYKFDPWEEKWNRYYNELLIFQNTNGHCDVDNGYTVKDIELGKWVIAQRRAYKLGTLGEDRIEKLNAIFFSWANQFENVWVRSYEQLKKYKNDCGNCSVPARYAVDGINLGAWVGTQRDKYRKGLLETDRIDKLNSVGFNWKAFKKTNVS